MGCPCLNEEKSGASNGCFCVIVNDYVEKKFRSHYCTSSADYEHCPNKGGDDRACNPNALTEKICSSILHSVAENMDYANRYICEILHEIYDRVENTSYEYLCQMILWASQERIEAPTIAGEIRELVQTNVERERAEDLECSLDKLFQGIQPCEYAGNVYCRGDLYIRTEDFVQLQCLVEEYCENAVSLINSSVDAGGISQYESVVLNAEERLGDSVTIYFQRILDNINHVWGFFERNCESVFSSMGVMNRIESNDHPKWEA